MHNDLIFLIDGSRGVHIPSFFVNEYGTEFGLSESNQLFWLDCLDMESEQHVSAWEWVLDNAICGTYRVIQLNGGDVWAYNTDSVSLKDLELQCF